MARQVTQWRPDTCACVVDLVWDDAVAEVDRSHSQGTLHNKCAAHAGVADVDVLTSLFGENQHKNRVIGKTIEVLGLETRDALANISFNFDGSRKMSVAVKGMTNAQKVKVMAALNADPNIDTSVGGRLKALIGT